MSIENYPDLKTSVADWLSRDDLTTQITDFISFGELRIARDMRLQIMETALSETIASGVIGIPTNYIELKHAYIDRSPTQWLERITSEKIYHKYPVRSAVGVPVYIAREGTSFIFGPFPDSTYDVRGIYYAKLPALSDSNTTNWFIDNAPDLLLYASLLEAAVFIEDDENALKYGTLYVNRKKEIQDQDDQENYSGSVLRTWVG